MSNTHCPRNKAHAAHDYTNTVPGMYFDLTTSEHCPGHDESDPRHAVYLAHRAASAARKVERRARRSRQMAEQHATDLAHSLV